MTGGVKRSQNTWNDYCCQMRRTLRQKWLGGRAEMRFSKRITDLCSEIEALALMPDVRAFSSNSRFSLEPFGSTRR